MCGRPGHDLLRCVDWLERRAEDVGNISASVWLAIAAWVAVVVLIGALVYAWRQYQRARQQAEELSQPSVAMFMEPAAGDWHLIELVVKNFGRTPAFGIRFEFAHPPTVGKYESGYDDRYVDIVPLNLPAEIPYLAPTQEWRMVWDSALNRKELGEAIASRFDGAVTYYDQPRTSNGSKKTRHKYRTTAILDWATLHPVERLEMLTTHDLARQEKQKLELLRHLLTYYHYASSESREEVLREEINRVRNAAEDLADRYRGHLNAVREDQARIDFDANNGLNGLNGNHDTHDNVVEFDDAQTQLINGRHRRGLP